MDSKESGGVPVRRPSWTGALGARLGRILNAHEEDDDATLRESVDIQSLRKGSAGEMVVGKKEGE